MSKKQRFTFSVLLVVALLTPGVILAQPAAPQAAAAPEAQAGAMLFVENAGSRMRPHPVVMRPIMGSGCRSSPKAWARLHISTERSGLQRPDLSGFRR